MILGDDEVIDTKGEVIAIEVRDDEEEATLDCNVMGVFGMTKGMKSVKQPTTMRLEGKLKGWGSRCWQAVERVTILSPLRSLMP